MRIIKQYPLTAPIEPEGFDDFETVLLLNSNGSGKNLLALGSKNEYLARSGGQTALNVLNHCTKAIDDWLFGYMGYDLKNSLEELKSENEDKLKAPLYHFWQPLVVFEWNENELDAHYIKLSEQEVDLLVNRLLAVKSDPEPSQPYVLEPKLSKLAYLESVAKLKEHIQQGDVYEVNYCQEFFQENVLINPFQVYKKLNELTKAPYSAYLKDMDLRVMSASPEMFLTKAGNRLWSSPIKGTKKRGETPEEDEFLKAELQANPKEQAENVMIVDLVRNDLAKIAQKGSVEVSELMAIHTFQSVHQLISTVSCQLAEGTSFVDIIKATFPMGSMTGAPKIAAMQLAETYENTKRGLYSGAIGYFRPNGDFQFNVVIRSLQYNTKNQYLSLMTGGAITHQSVPEEEYQETLLKAEAIMRSLQG